MIAELLKELDDDLPDLRPCAIVGPVAFSNTEEQVIIVLVIFNLKRYSLKSQRAFLDALATGTYNLVVATKYVEYLDLPPLSVIVQYVFISLVVINLTDIFRFNLFEKPPFNILSRARSETKDTLLVHMVERDNDLHTRMLELYREAATEITHPMIRTTTARSLVREDSTSDSENEREEAEFIEDPITCRRINRFNSTALVHRVADAVGEKPLFQLREDSHGKYTCSIEFPMGLSARRVEGSKSVSVAEAKSSTSFHLCRQLFDRGLLGSHFFPPATEGSTEDTSFVDAEGHASNASATTRAYPRNLPRFWVNTLPALRDRLFPVIISVGRFREEHHAPVLILSRFWLPDLPKFPVFSSGSCVTVQFRKGAPIRVDKAKLEALRRYTLRISRAVVNKPFECSIETMPYFFAPMASGWDETTAESNSEGFPVVTITWDDVTRAVDGWATPLLPPDGQLPLSMIQDAIIQDRAVEFTNRHFLLRVREDLTPLSKAAEGEVRVCRPRFVCMVLTSTQREASYSSFLEYCKSRRKDFVGLKDESQPLVEVAPVPPCINNLSSSSKANGPLTKFPAKCEKCTSSLVTLPLTESLRSDTRAVS